MPPTISVVLPSFNGSRYLASSIESCVRQSIADWELIVVDDGSTDHTLEIAATFSRIDPRVRLARHDRNMGLPAALNTGFSMAQGEFLTWTSDDNLYVPTAFEEMLVNLQQDKVSDIVYANYYLLNSANDVVSINYVSEITRLVSGNCVGPCFLYRASVQEKVGGYNTERFLAEDLDFWLRASMHFQFRRLTKPLMYYRIHPGSLTSRRCDEIADITELTLVDFLPRLPWASRQLRARGFLALALNKSRRHQNGCAARYLLRALAGAPGFCLWHTASVLWRRAAAALQPRPTA